MALHTWTESSQDRNAYIAMVQKSEEKKTSYQLSMLSFIYLYDECYRLTSKGATGWYFLNTNAFFYGVVHILVSNNIAYFKTNNWNENNFEILILKPNNKVNNTF